MIGSHFKKTFNEINYTIKDFKDFEFNCLVINDVHHYGKIKHYKTKNLTSLKIINMKENQRTR